jgi:2'-5' RNA ligase
VLWLGVGDPAPSALLALQGDLEAAARRLGVPPEERAFHPHLTLARAIPGTRPPPPPPEAPGPEPWSVTVREVVLYESRLGAGGARYTALETFPLGGRSPEPAVDGRA